MKKSFLCLMLLLISHNVFAYLPTEMNSLVGYTAIGEKRIVGWLDQNGKHDGFEGCDYDRVIIFSDDRVLVCKGYHYNYSYNPTALIFSNGYEASKNG